MSKENLQYIEKEELTQGVCNLKLYTEHVYPVEQLQFRATSGTSGRGVALMVARSVTYKRFSNAPRHALLRIGLSNTNVFGGLNMCMHDLTFKRVSALTAADIVRSDLAAIIRSFKPTELQIAPFALLRTFLHNLRDSGALDALNDLRSIDISGEYTTREEFQKIRSLLPKGTILVNDYGMGEVGMIAYSCPLLEESHADISHPLLHPLSSVPIHITDVNEYSIGNLAVQIPDIGWYKTGDAAQLIEEQCGCGEKMTLIVHGRLDYDWVSCAGALIVRSVVDEVFNTLTKEVADYRIEVSELDDGVTVRGRIHVIVVPTENLQKEPCPEEYIANIINRSLQISHSHTLDDLIRKGVFFPTRVSFVPEITQGSKRIPLKKVSWSDE